MLTRWEEYKVDFEWDGSLRDIYVLGTSVADWQALLHVLSSGAYECAYFVDGKTASFPSSVVDIFDRSTQKMLVVTIGSIVLNCHFWNDWEIEFDIDPREIQSQREAEQIFDFMRYLGHLLNKEVILTPENLQSSPIFRFTPEVDEVRYIPPSF